MLMTAGSCGPGSGPEWRDWNFVFGTDKTKSNQNNSRADKAFILLTKSPSPHELRGTVQLSKTTPHTGLLIELQGSFTPQNSYFSVPLLLKNEQNSSPFSPNSSVFHHICGSRKEPSTCPAFKKYPFALKLSSAQNLPPTFSHKSVGAVEYSLVVWVQKDGRSWNKLGEKVISYVGGLPINPGIHLKSILETEISGEGGLRATLQLPRKEFLRSEEIPFTIQILDPSAQGVKKVSIYLWIMFSYQAAQEVLSGSQVVDCVTFKKFLKRDRVSRDGKFSPKISIPTFIGEIGPRIKITYVIQINLTTKDSSTFSSQTEIIIGTESTRPSPSAPEEAVPGPSAPLLEEDDSDRCPSAPMATMSLASSLLSLFPPGYSALSSRAGSTLSLETLPPHYDDI